MNCRSRRTEREQGGRSDPGQPHRSAQTSAESHTLDGDHSVRQSSHEAARATYDRRQTQRADRLVPPTLAAAQTAAALRRDLRHTEARERTARRAAGVSVGRVGKEVDYRCESAILTIIEPKINRERDSISDSSCGEFWKGRAAASRKASGNINPTRLSLVRNVTGYLSYVVTAK